MASTSEKAWTCMICCYDYLGEPTLIDDSALCSSCITQLFRHALASEDCFPPRWGDKALDAWDFRKALDTKTLTLFQQKDREWSCPAKERVYCRQKDPPRRPTECAHFLGRTADTTLCRRCDSCMWYTCLRCLECFSIGKADGKLTTIDHECDPNVEKRLREKAFEGLRRGKDYQDCPNQVCQRRIELREGCNHITCPCGTEYCYICGSPVESGQGYAHWRSGGCPQYGQPHSGREMFYDAFPLLDTFLPMDGGEFDWQTQLLLLRQRMQQVQERHDPLDMFFEAFEQPLEPDRRETPGRQTAPVEGTDFLGQRWHRRVATLDEDRANSYNGERQNYRQGEEESGSETHDLRGREARMFRPPRAHYVHRNTTMPRNGRRVHWDMRDSVTDAQSNREKQDENVQARAQRSSDHGYPEDADRARRERRRPRRRPHRHLRDVFADAARDLGDALFG